MNSIRFLLVFTIISLFSGCFYDSKALKLGIIPWIGYESMYQAKEFGWIDPKIEFVEGEIASDSFKRIMSGEVDAAAMTIDDVLLARSKGIDLTIVAVLDISAGADVVLSKTPMKDLKELKGKRIAYEKGALGSLILTKILQKADLTMQDVIVRNISPQNQYDAWEKDEIDVAITYEPFASKLLKTNAHYLLSTHDLPEMIFDVLAVRTDRLQGRENTIRNLVRAHFKALDYLHNNYQDVTYRIASRQKISPQDVKRSIGGVILPSKVANQTYLRGDSRLMHSLNELNLLMSEKGYMARKVSLDRLITAEYLKD